MRVSDVLRSVQHAAGSRIWLCCRWCAGKDSVNGPKPWDFAAGQLIVEEAGGICSDHDLTTFSITSGRVLCGGTRQLLTELSAAIVR